MKYWSLYVGFTISDETHRLMKIAREQLVVDDEDLVEIALKHYLEQFKGKEEVISCHREI